jgi:hypothetical protein
MTKLEVLNQITALMEGAADATERGELASLIRAHTFAVLHRVDEPAEFQKWDKPGTRIIGAYMPPTEWSPDTAAVRSMGKVVAFNLKARMLKDALAPIPAGAVVEIIYIGQSWSAPGATKVFAVVQHAEGAK